MNEFEFSIRKHLKQAWHLFAEHVWYFVGIAAVMAILNVASDSHHNDIVKGIAGIATIIWTYVSLSSALAAVDGKNGMLTFEALPLHLPRWKEFWQFFAVILVSVLIIVAGLIVVIIPGVFFVVKLMFSQFAYIDKKEGVIPSLRTSWRMVHKHIFWTAFLCFVIGTALVIGGVLIVGIGVLVTYPIAIIFFALLYRSVITFSPQSSSQPSSPSTVEARASETV